ncbi:MAG: hypothetical protein ACYDD4_11015 [Acidimicrobiales bacterium]
MTTSERPEAGAVPVEQLSFTAASRELDAIVEFFEQRDVDVDQLVGRLERATAIVDELDRRITRTRAQVEQLVPRLEAAGRSAGTGSPDDDDEIADDEIADDEGDDAQAHEGDDASLF